MEELFDLTKQALSIIPDATLKDSEIKVLIEAGIADLERQGIMVNIDNDLIRIAIVMFVKGNFGNVDIKEKEFAKATYSLLCHNLGLSFSYLQGGDNNA